MKVEVQGRGPPFADSELFGVVPIIPTPFTENEEIDEAALRDLIDFAVSSGI